MIKLYGFRLSNYYNMVKLALLEKDLAFEEIPAMPSQEPDFTMKSPMGKVPCIETGNGFLSETGVILDYLEESFPQKPLYPSDPFARAKLREIIRCCELYVELAARRHYGHVFFGEEINQAAMTEVRPVMEKGLRALRQLVDFDPFIGGKQFSHADIVAYHCFSYPAEVARTLYDWDIFTEVDGLLESRERVARREHCRRVDEDWQAAFTEFRSAAS